jgi:DNA-binding MarR family transcriptional regulator
VVLNPVRAHIEHGYTLKEIADYLHFHYAAVSRAIKRIGTDNV